MKLRPLGNRVVLRYPEPEEKTKSGIILPDSAKEKPQEAIVLAVGQGKGPDGEEVAMQVKEGDRVILDNLSRLRPGMSVDVAEEGK